MSVLFNERINVCGGRHRKCKHDTRACVSYLHYNHQVALVTNDRIKIKKVVALVIKDRIKIKKVLEIAQRSNFNHQLNHFFMPHVIHQQIRTVTHHKLTFLQAIKYK